MMPVMRIIAVVARVRLPRYGGKRWCWNKELRLDQTDAAVWQEVCRLLEEPERLEQEYRQRLQPPQRPDEHAGLEAQMGKLRRGIARLIDSYAEGLIDKQEFEPRVTRMRERMQHLEEELQRLQEATMEEEELRLILGRLETFAAKVKEGLDQADFQTRREIIRALVKRVEVLEQQIRIVFRISPTTLPPSSGGTPHTLQHYGGRVHACTLEGQLLYLEAGEPLFQRQQITSHGREALGLFLHLSIGGSDEDGDHDGLFVDIDPSTAFIEHLHRCSSSKIE